MICADKNSKEQFIKKLQMCMKTYDYKDEQKDVKGKVSSLNQIYHFSNDWEPNLTIFQFTDRTPQRYLRAPANAHRLEKCCVSDHP